MRMKRNYGANALVAVVVTDAAFQCAVCLVAYLKSSKANTHDVHICGSVVVVVMGMVVLGSRMVCSDSKSTTARSSGVMRVLLVVAETAARKKELRLAL